MVEKKAFNFTSDMSNLFFFTISFMTYQEYIKSKHVPCFLISHDKKIGRYIACPSIKETL